MRVLSVGTSNARICISRGEKKSVCVIIYVCVFGEEYFKNYNKMLSLIRKMDSPAHAGNPKSVLT